MKPHFFSFSISHSSLMMHSTPLVTKTQSDLIPPLEHPPIHKLVALAYSCFMPNNLIIVVQLKTTNETSSRMNMNYFHIEC